jgi:tetrahydromethanopterin S-methyltransferase subunit E
MFVRLVKSVLITALVFAAVGLVCFRSSWKPGYHEQPTAMRTIGWVSISMFLSAIAIVAYWNFDEPSATRSRRDK